MIELGIAFYKYFSYLEKRSRLIKTKGYLFTIFIWYIVSYLGITDFLTYDKKLFGLHNSTVIFYSCITLRFELQLSIYTLYILIPYIIYTVRCLRKQLEVLGQSSSIAFRSFFIKSTLEKLPAYCI